MINKLNNRIKAESERIWQSNPLFISVRNGEYSLAQHKRYLYNLVYLFQNTTRGLDLAIAECTKKNLTQLNEFMHEKKREETGHDQWAIDDLRRLGYEYSGIQDELLLDEIKELVCGVRLLILEDPKLYLAYMIWSEAVTVQLGPRYLNALEEKCNISRKSVSAVANHEVLDRDHVNDDMAMILKMFNGSNEEFFYEALSKSVTWIENFFSSCVTTKLNKHWLAQNQQPSLSG